MSPLHIFQLINAMWIPRKFHKKIQLPPLCYFSLISLIILMLSLHCLFHHFLSPSAICLPTGLQDSKVHLVCCMNHCWRLISETSSSCWPDSFVPTSHIKHIFKSKYLPKVFIWDLEKKYIKIHICHLSEVPSIICFSKEKLFTFC